MDLTADRRADPQVSVGAGIAIAGIWLAASALTAILVLTVFVWSPPPPSAVKLDAEEAMLLLFLLAAPMVAAYFATKLVLGRDA